MNMDMNINTDMRMVISIGIKISKSLCIKSFFKNLACDWGIDDKVQFISEFDCPGTGIISTLIEQTPGVQSYVTIGDEVDAIGLRKARLHWELNAEDKELINAAKSGHCFFHGSHHHFF